jgi:gliding motility-associated-like protein
VDYDQDNVSDVQAPTGMVTPSYTYPIGQTQGIISVRPDYLGCTENTKTTLLANAPVSGNHYISQLEVADPASVSLIFQDVQANIPYVLERSANGTGSFSVIDQFTSTSSTSDNTVNTDQNFYCYRLGARDVCNNQTFYTNTICSHTIDLDIRDGSNLVAWKTTLPGAGSLTMMRNGSPISLAFTNNGTYTDADVTCGTDYCYNLITAYGGDVYSISNVTCGKAISSAPPTPVSDITSVVDGNSVRLEWVPSPGYTIAEYGIYRIPTNVSIPYAKTAEPTLTDNTYQPFQGVCYEIRFDDVCANRSGRSQAVCPIELKATLNNNDNSVLLEWNAYNGWNLGIDHYVIEKYDGDGQLISSMDYQQTSFTDNTASPGQVFTYRILAVPVSGSVPEPSISNTQTIIKSVMLYHPTAFIPINANDDRNKTFSVLGIEEYITSYELRIFNRWGELMFHTTDMSSGWDGTFKGVTMPEGTYIFKTQIVDTAGRTFDYSGSVVLLRK